MNQDSKMQVLDLQSLALVSGGTSEAIERAPGNSGQSTNCGNSGVSTNCGSNRLDQLGTDAAALR